MQTLEPCALCLRVTRDWKRVELQVGGVGVWSGRCCRGCANEVESVVKQLVRESRAAAVRS